MILAETTVVVSFCRAPTPRLQQIIHNQQAAICGVTLAEIYAGARNPPDLARLATILGVFGTVVIPHDIWDKLGHNLFALRIHGFTFPFPDVLIATVAIEHDLELWTHDNHFALIQTVLPQLKLFQEPP